MPTNACSRFPSRLWAVTHAIEEFAVSPNDQAHLPRRPEGLRALGTPRAAAVKWSGWFGRTVLIILFYRCCQLRFFVATRNKSGDPS